MTTKKGNDDDDMFDPLEALADVVTGDAFSFFDEPVKAVEKVTNGTDSGTSGEDASGSGQSGSNGREPKRESKLTVKPLPPPTKKGEAPGVKEPSEGGDASGGGKEGDGGGAK